MIIKTFDMSVDGLSDTAEKPKLTSYILDNELVGRTYVKKRPAVIVCPGGGYKSRSVRESEAIALRYCAAGFHAFLLDYSVNPAEWPIPQRQLSKAVITVREIADEYLIDKNNVYVCGFSAGGHLAASLGVHYDNPIICDGSGTENGENRPDGLILCYPVIIDDEGKTHEGTKQNFVGGNPKNLQYFGLDRFVNKNTPKCFIWHTFEDSSVPVLSSMRFASALLENEVEYELHIFPKGKHGLALGNMLTACEPKHLEPAAAEWMDLSIRWLYSQTNMGM